METQTKQDLKKVAQAIVKNIKAIQKHCKENNIDLHTFLSEKEYKQYQKDVAFVKKYLPEIKADALATKQKQSTEPQDISEPAFVDAVLQWKKKLLEDFLKVKKDYEEVAIDPIKFSQNISSNSSALPINEALYEEWAYLVSKTSNPSTGSAIFELLIKNEATTWMIAGDKGLLMKHYRVKGNKKVYKEYEDTRIDGALPQINLFLAAIKASTKANDPNLPDNKTAKAAADKAKSTAYQKVLNAWKAEEVANLSYESGDDTIYVDMSMINAGDPRVSIHNLPIALKSNLLTAILDEAKKGHSRKQSVKDLKNIAINALNTFHTQNLHKKESYQDLTLEEIEVIKFPSNISGWILSYQVVNKDENPKVKEYALILENWCASERASLDSSNASEHLIIDPALLKTNSNLVRHAGIPDKIRTDFLVAIKAELEQVEKQEGVLDFNKAAGLARNQVAVFARDYNIDNIIFNYKQLEVEEIRKLQFPSGIHAWIKEAEVEGNKKDVKKDIKAELNITLKNDFNFNLEALIKELKIDMGGITINNDFNFDNDMHLTYNSLQLILKELIEINKSKEPKKKPKTKIKTASAELVIKDFYTSYYDSCYYGGSLKLQLNSKKDADGTYTLSFGKDIEIKKTNASLLNLYETVLEKTPSIKLKKKEKKVVKINFALTYKYNQEASIAQTKDNAYTITEMGGNGGAEVSIRFVKLYAGANFKRTNVSEKTGEAIIQGSTDKTFTDYYSFEISIENTANGIELGQGKDISFADSNYTRIAPQLKEKIGLCGNIELQ